METETSTSEGAVSYGFYSQTKENRVKELGLNTHREHTLHR